MQLKDIIWIFLHFLIQIDPYPPFFLAWLQKFAQNKHWESLTYKILVNVHH
jgi:hypothetical protein